MSETKFTPGPWSSDDDMISVEDQADMIKDNIGTDREWQAVGIHDGKGMAEIVALCHPINARLIAGAPCLLEAIEEYLESRRTCKNKVSAKHKLDAAIAKAKGTK